MGDRVVQLVGGRLAAGENIAKFTAAHLLQELVQLRLEKDDQGQNAVFQNLAQQEIHRVEPEDIGQAQSPQNQDDAPGHLAGAGGADQIDQPVYEKGHNGDIDNIGDGNHSEIGDHPPCRRGDLFHCAPSFRTYSVYLMYYT